MPTILDLQEKVTTLKEERASLVFKARKIIDTAEGEDRGMTDEEESRYDDLFNDIGDFTERAQRLEGQIEQERRLKELGGDGGFRHELNNGDERGLSYDFESRGMQGMGDGVWVEEAWRRILQTGQGAYRAGFRDWLRRGQVNAEMRALQVDLDTAGGYLTAPVQFVDQILKEIDNRVYMRQWATVFSVPSADSLGVVSLDNDPANPTWTHELNFGSEDSTMSFGKRELHPHPLAKYIKVSRTLMRKVPSVDSLVQERLGYKFGVAAENAFQNGDGAREPLGVFTASDDGISTSRDVSTGNDTDSPTFDGLIEAKYTLKTQYWPRARWMFHRDGVKKIAKLKDGEGQYIWTQSVRQGEPDTIMGVPVFMSEYTPNTFTTGQYVGVLGDFRYYHIADALVMEFQRLVEKYAATNQVAIVGRMESDGMPVLEEAFVRVTLG